MKIARTACRQACLAAGLAMFLAVSGRAAPGASLSFSNKVATFEDSAGRVYLEATLLRADFNADGTGQIIYRTNGDYNALSFAKLSPDTLARLGVPADFAEIARIRDEQKQEAAAKAAQAVAEEQQRLLDPANLVPVRVDAILSKTGYDQVYGDVYTCRVQFGQNPTLLKILVARLPERVASYYDRVAQQEQAVAALQNQIAYGQSWIAGASQQLSWQRSQIDQNAAQVRAATAGMADWVYPAAVQREAIESARRQEERDASSLTNAQSRLKSDQSRLKDLDKELLTLRDSEPAATTLLMLQGRRTLNGFKIFVCAPESVQPQVNVSENAPSLPKPSD